MSEVANSLLHAVVAVQSALSEGHEKHAGFVAD